MKFWVLELGAPFEMPQWCSRTTTVLKKHRLFLSQLRRRGVRLTLYVSTSRSPHGFRLGPKLIHLLSLLEITLEHDYIE